MLLNMLRDWRPYGISALLIAASSMAVYLKEDVYNASTTVLVEKGVLFNTESLNESFVASTVQRVFRKRELTPISLYTNFSTDYIKEAVTVQLNRTGESWNPSDIYSVTVHAKFPDGKMSTNVANMIAMNFTEQANELSGDVREARYEALSVMDETIEGKIRNAERNMLALKSASKKGLDTSVQIAKYERVIENLNIQRESVLERLNDAQFEVEIANNDNFEILELATGEGALEGPSKMKLYLMALFGSIFVGFGGWAFKLHNDNMIKAE